MLNRIALLALLVMIWTAFPVIAQDATPVNADANTAQEEQAMGYVRVAHFSPDTPAASLEFSPLDSETMDAQPMSLDELTYPEISSWMAVPAGTYSLSAGSESDLSLPEVSILADTWQTIALTGSSENGTLNAQVIQEDFTPFTPGTSRINFVNAIEGSTGVNVNRDGIAFINALNYGPENLENGMGMTIDSGVYDFSFAPADTPESVIGDLPQAEISEINSYLVALVGAQDGEGDAAPQVVVYPTRLSEVARLQGTLEEPGTVMDALRSDERFSEFTAAIEEAGLEETLNSAEALTLLAPTNDAFNGLTENQRNQLAQDPDALSNLLNHHIIEGEYTSQQIFDSDNLTSMSGGDLQVSESEGSAIVNDSQIIIVNIPAENGVIHGINNVILPES
jgi:uncharacterized surface protein with fasciclin (FAS1) repeats